MKKFVSMAMVAAMTTSMVPATAFAGIGSVEATASIVDAWTVNKAFGKDYNGEIKGSYKSVPELQIKITDTNYKQTIDGQDYEAEITVALDNAELTRDFTTDNIGVRVDKDAVPATAELVEARGNLVAAANAVDGGSRTNTEAGVSDLKDRAEMTAWDTVVGASLVGTYNQKVADYEAELKKPANVPPALNTALQTAKDNLAVLEGQLATLEDAVTTAQGNATNAQNALDTKTKAYNKAKAAEAAAADAIITAKAAFDALDNGSGTGHKNGPTATAAEKEAWATAKMEYTNAQVRYDASVNSGYFVELNGSKDGIQNSSTSTEMGATAGQLDPSKSYKGLTAAADVAMKNAEAALNGGQEYELKGTSGADALVVQAAATSVAKADAKAEILKAAQTALNEQKDDLEADIADAEQDVKNAEDAVKNGATGPAVTAAKAAMDAAWNALEPKLLAYDKAYDKYTELAEQSKGDDGFKIEAVEGITPGSNARAAVSAGSDEFTFKVKGQLHKGDVIYIDLNGIQMDKTSVGRQATLDVESDDLNIDVQDLVYVAVEEYGITATTKKIGNIAEEEYRELEKNIKVESVVGDFVNGQEFELKLSNGFEFKSVGGATDSRPYTITKTDDDTAKLIFTGAADEFDILAEDIEIEATSAKSGKEATMTIKAIKGGTGTFKATAKVVVMKVVDYTVMMTVDEDEDVPVIYSGVNVENYGITDDSDHVSLEVTIEESFPGAWTMRKGFNLELPDGVYVTDLEVLTAENFTKTGSTNTNAEDWTEAFEEAYKETDHKYFEFDKRTFDDVNTELNDECAELTFEMTLVADPGFVGDVNLKLTGDLVDEQEVTIAKFATPYYVTAEQNDLKIDYRYTEVPSEVVITEAEAGLWDKDEAKFALMMEKYGDNFFEFEDADVTVNEDASGMEIKSDVKTGVILVEMEDDSDDEAGVITVSNMEMFMSRSIPAGPYDLEASSTLGEYYLAQTLFAADDSAAKDHAKEVDYVFYDYEHDCDDCDKETHVGCVADFSNTVKEAFINVVTAGREQDDASFTTKVVVPVGESYIVAGEQQITLDVPAYVSAAGYTMLPVRAVATALGINNNNVIWNGETKTVTILYGQRIITMVAGQKTVNVNGSVIPASAAVEIVDGRTFLPMRDLATALGVTDITWDAATKTATLNGGVVAE